MSPEDRQRLSDFERLGKAYQASEKAVARTKAIERRLRDVALLPICEIINGVQVEQLKFKHYKILSAMESPFIAGGVADMFDVGAFMWVVSGQYNPEANGRDEYIDKILSWPSGANFFRAIRRYIERATFDTPPMLIGKSKQMATSVSIGIAHKIMFAYKCRLSEVDEMTISAIFQFLKWISVENDHGYPQFNPLSDRVKAKAMERVNRGNGKNGG